MPDRTVTRAPGLSMFFPAYNDAGTIASLVIQAQEAIRQLTPDFEVIVVNDGSRDQTGQIAEELARTYPNVRVIHHIGNRGLRWRAAIGLRGRNQGARSRTRTATPSTIRTEIAALWERLGDDADMVTGYKISRSDPLHRIVIGRVYHFTVKMLFALRVRDVDCDFRLMRREVFDRVKLDRDSGVICLELMRKVQDAGFRVVEVPVHHYHRTHGRSQFFNFRQNLPHGHRCPEALDRARGARPRQTEHAGAVPQSDGAASFEVRVHSRSPTVSAARRRVPVLLRRTLGHDHGWVGLHRKQSGPPAR